MSQKDNGFLQSWIFSARLDFLVFWLPVIIALLSVFLVKHYEVNIFQSIFWYLIIRGWLDIGHVFVSIFPLYQLMKLKKIAKESVFIFTLVLLMLSFYFVFYSTITFVFLVILMQIIHTMLQQFGWIMVSRKKCGDNTSELLDTIFFINCIVPLQWVFSSHIELPSLFNSLIPFQQQPYHMPEWFFLSSLILHWVVNIGYVLRCIYLYKEKGQFNLAKYSIFLSTWCIVYGAVVILESIEFYIIGITLSHTISYLLYVKGMMFRPVEGVLIYKSKISFTAAFILVFILTGTFWTLGLSYDFKVPGTVMIFWFPLLFHYIGDGYLWKTRNWGY